MKIFITVICVLGLFATGYLVGEMAKLMFEDNTAAVLCASFVGGMLNGAIWASLWIVGTHHG